MHGCMDARCGSDVQRVLDRASWRSFSARVFFLSLSLNCNIACICMYLFWVKMTFERTWCDILVVLYIIVHSLGSSKKSTVQEGMRACTQCPLGEPLAMKGIHVRCQKTANILVIPYRPKTISRSHVVLVRRHCRMTQIPTRWPASPFSVRRIPSNPQGVESYTAKCKTSFEAYLSISVRDGRSKDVSQFVLQSGNGNESCEVKNLRAGPGAKIF